jgi:hypothetical protein
MSLATYFGWSNVVTPTDTELPDIFPLTGVLKSDFIKTDVIAIYAKILTDVIERTHGLALLWDNCLKSESEQGLISMLAIAMTEKADLFLVYNKEVGVVRKATHDEKIKIEADYKKNAESSVGIFISFKKYTRTDMIMIYSGLEFCTISALHKSMNLSKAIQIKISDLRASVNLTDASIAKSQAQTIARGLGQGKDVYMDAKDVIETSKPDLESVKQAIGFLNQKRSFYLGLPESYINGIQTGGLGTTGENDTKAVERGLKSYYFAIIRPVVYALFNVKLDYKSQDFRQITQGLEALKTFELTGEEFLSSENKKRIVEGIFDVDPDDNETEAPVEPITIEGKPNGTVKTVKAVSSMQPSGVQ